MATFGVDNGLAITSDGAVLVSKSITPRGASVAEALNENGDIAVRHYYAEGVTTEVQETYAIKGSVAPTLPKIGYNEFGVVTNVSISTSNSDWVQVSVTYTTGVTLDTNKTYTIPFACPTGRKATLIMLSGGEYVQSSSATITCTLSELLDNEGIPCAWAVSGGAWDVTAEAIGGKFEFTAEDGISGITENDRVSESNTAYGTISASASGFITPDA